MRAYPRSCVDNENKDRRRGRFFDGRVVLDGGVLGEKLGGEILIGDGCVVGREMVASEADRADPDLGGVIDGGKRVEDEATSAAAEGGVTEDGHGREWLDRSVDDWVIW
ncbi:hypothetical protein ACFX2J_026669 [Malus domestica]|uniref:Uncharacterized protein n=1 Tax=Malus domestica TaxID=3750 RepID=A0A498KG93_MALDO|nr:hypothetical protein DVH24_018449 [Malus domestica]